MDSDTGLSERSFRPGVYGTLTAADAGSRGGLHPLPERSDGVYNLPRYYPKYKSFGRKDDKPDDRIYYNGKTTRHGDSQSRPFDTDSTSSRGKRTDGDLVYAKPRKGKEKKEQPQQQTRDNEVRDRRKTEKDYNETFTVVDGFDTRSLNERKRRNRLITTIVILTILAMALIAVAVFLGVYLGGKFT